LGTTQTRVIGGENCISDTSPVVQLVVLDEEDNPVSCSATMISSKQGITAAHCFADFFVASAFIEIGVRKILVNRFTIHPKVETRGNLTFNDIAIFELDEDSPFAPTQIGAGLSVSVGDTMYIYGYGETSEGPVSAGTLRGGKMIVSEVDENFIRARFIEGTQNSCRGDSGGPAFLDVEGRLQQVGVISSGTLEDCSIGDETIFINLQGDSAVKFINEQLPQSELDG
jgi:secreted trypsin-like serine protease